MHIHICIQMIMYMNMRIHITILIQVSLLPPSVRFLFGRSPLTTKNAGVTPASLFYPWWDADLAATQSPRLASDSIWRPGWPGSVPLGRDSESPEDVTWPGRGRDLRKSCRISYHELLYRGDIAFFLTVTDMIDSAAFVA